MDNPFLTTCILLFLIIDPIGNLVAFATILKNFDATRRRRIILRECLIGCAILVIFALWGRSILSALNLSNSSLGITGGIMLFLIAIKMLFKDGHGIADEMEHSAATEPFIVPLAMPLFAGPAAIATIVLRATQFPGETWNFLGATLLTGAVATAIIVFGDSILHRIGHRGVNALERLMGLLLTILSVQMILDGIGTFVAGLPR